MNNLATEIHNQGRWEEAEKLSREVLDIQRRVLGSEHPETLKSMHNVAYEVHGQSALCGGRETLL